MNKIWDRLFGGYKLRRFPHHKLIKNLRWVPRFFGYDIVALSAIYYERLKMNRDLTFKEVVTDEILNAPITRLTGLEQHELARITANLQSPGPIIEFGTLFGSSAKLISAVKTLERKFYTVDNCSFNPLSLNRQMQKRIIEDALSNYDSMNVEFCYCDITAFQTAYSAGSPSMVFIDADHSYESVRADISWALSVGSEIICGHDYHQNNSFPGVRKAVDEFGGPSKVVDSLWILSKQQ